MSTRLNEQEIGSAAWQKVRTELHDRLKRHRARVENPEVSEAERFGLCWRIRELKELLRMEEPAPNPDAGE
jgi:hypothetical protein